MFGMLGFSAAMGKRQKQVSRPSSSRSENTKAMPIDLLIEILSRLPLEDVARCRCVSKLWSSILRRPDFTELFLKMSTTRPRLLFAFIHYNKRIFYSAPQNLNPDRNYSYTLSPYYHMDFPKGLGNSEFICAPIRGLICNQAKKPMIYNPSTGEYITLPKATTKRVQMSSHLGYDAIENVFKVLCVSENYDDFACRVTSLGVGEITWRKIGCWIPHQPLHTEICIDGVLYYLAKWMGIGTSERYLVVCFDIRREKFKFLPYQFRILSSALVNFKGKLGVLLPADSGGIHELTEGFELRVLEDADEFEWSKTIYVLPSCWRNLAAGTWLYIVGMTNAGEIVLSTCFLREPFYTFYYNIVKNTVVRVEIQFGVVAVKAYFSKIFTFIDHVENVELID